MCVLYILIVQRVLVKAFICWMTCRLPDSTDDSLSTAPVTTNGVVLFWDPPLSLKKKKVVIIDFFFLLCKLLLVSSWILLLCPLLRTELDFTWANFVLLLLLPSAVACGLCSYEIKSWSLRTDVNKQAWTQTDAFSHPPSFSPVGNLLTSVKFKKEGTHWSGLSFVFLVLFTGGHLWKGKQMEHRLKGQSWVIQPNPLVSAATMSYRSCSWVYQDGSCLTVVLSEEYRPVLIKLNAVQFDLLRGGILFM